MGRAKKAADIAELQGQPGKRRKSSAPTVVERPVADDLGHLPEGVRAVWREIVATPTGQAILKSSDHFMLERYCTLTYEFRALNAALTDKRAKGGLRLYVTHSREGYGDVTKPRPEWSMRNQISAELRLMEQQLGLTPSSRASVLSRLAATRDPTKPPLAGDDMAQGGAAPSDPRSPIGLMSPARVKH